MATSLNLVVLRSNKPKALAESWEHLDLTFSPEKHGAGPVHYVTNIGDVVLEIYPGNDPQLATAGVRIGLVVSDLETVLAGLPGDMRLVEFTNQPRAGNRAVVIDFEGHKIELLQEA